MNNKIKQPRLIFNPRLGRRERFWPVAQLTQFFKKCRQRYDFELWIVAGASDQEYIEQVMAEMGERKPMVIELLNLEELAKLFSSGAIFIGVETGTSRLAASLGLPTIIIAGPTQPGEWTLSDERVMIINKKIACSPCSLQRQALCQDKLCFQYITPEDLLEKVDIIMTGEGEQKVGGGTRI